jgi:putative transposase
MARPLREIHPGFPHHVILRGNNHRRLFSRPGDYQRFLSFLAESLRKNSVALHAITLMANHVHTILRPGDRESLVRVVKSTAQRYAVYRNRRRGGTGKLFEQRYQCIPVRTDEQLGIVTCYSDLNAVRAGLVDDPLKFRWSTYALHVGLPDRGDIPVELWTPSAWYLALGSDPALRALRYAEATAAYVEHSLPERHSAIAAAIEAVSNASDGRRLERPDRTRANEDRAAYGKVRGMPENTCEADKLQTGE